MNLPRFSRILAAFAGALAFGAAVHAQAPTVTIVSPTVGTTNANQVTVTILATANGGATFTGSAGNTATIASIQGSGGTINGGPANGSATLPFSGFGTSVIVVSTVVNLTQGTYSITANVTDSNGLTGTAHFTLHVSSGGNGINTSASRYPVTFNPVTEIANGNLPYVLTIQGSSIPGYFLQVTGPNDPNSQDYPFTVTYQVSILSGPGTSAQALSYVTIDSYNTATQTDNNDGQTSPQNNNQGATVTVQFTQPSQTITLHVQETMTDPSVSPGDYLYQIAGTWISTNGDVVSGTLGGTTNHTTPGNAYIVEYGAGNTSGEPTINSNVTLPQVTSAPVAVIKVPPTATTEYIYPDTLDPEQYPTSATVDPIVVEGDYTSINSKVTSINIYWGTQSNPTEQQLTETNYNQDTSYASYSLSNGVLSLSTTSNVGDAVAASTGPEVGDPGLYTISATASSNGDTSAIATQQVDVVATLSPGVAINSPADGSTIAIAYPGATATPAFNVSGNASAVVDYLHGDSTVNIGEVDYNLYDSNGNEVSGFNGSAVPGSGNAFFGNWVSNSANIPLPTSTGQLPTLAPGTYTLIVTASNIAGAQTAISTFTVAQVPEPTVTLTLNPGSSQVSVTGNGGGLPEATAAAVNIPAGHSSVTVPYVASGAFLGAGTLDATFTSAAVTSAVAGFIAPSIATGGATFTTSGTSITFTTPGTYTLTAQDSNSSGSTDANGTTATASITIVVTGEPNPFITLTAGPSGSAVTAMGVGAGSTGTATLAVVIPAGSSSVSVPYSVSGGITGLLGSDLTSAVITASNNLLNFLAPLLLSAPTPTVSANSSISFTAPGTYSISASDSNTGLLGLLLGATANATITFNVQQAATPSVSLSATAPGSTAVTATGTGGPNPTSSPNTVNVTIPASGSVTVPYAASGKVAPTGTGVIDGVITSASVTSTLPGFSGPGIATGGSSFATSGTSITFTAPGTYTLTVSGSNVSGSDGYGSAASATLTFVVAQASIPSVSLAIGGVTATGNGSTSVPANLTVTIPAGQTSITVPYVAGGSVTGGSVDATLTSAGVSVSPSLTGFSSPPISGIPGSTSFTTNGASITFTAGGTYILTAADSNSSGAGDVNGVTASAPVNITVKQVATPSVTIAYSPTGTGSQTSTVTSTGGGTAGTASISVAIPANAPNITIPYTASGKLGTGTVDATLTSASVSLSPSVTGFSAPAISVPTTSFSTTGTSIVFSAPGTYTLTATDSNAGSDSNGVPASVTLKIMVTQVAAPTVSLTVGSNPAVTGTGGVSNGSGSITVQIPAGQSNVSVPYTASFGISGSGTDNVLTSAGVASTAPNFTVPTVAIPTGAPTPGFSTTGQSLTFNTAGSYTLTAKASNSTGSGDTNGTTASATFNITVQQTPNPTVKLVATPAGGSAVTASGVGGTPASATVNLLIPAGQTSIGVPYTASGAISGTGIDNVLTSASVSASSNLTGFVVPAIAGLPAASFATNGTSVTFSAGGNYSVTAVDSNVSGSSDTNGTSASATLNFNVQQVATPTVTLTVSPAGAAPATATGTGGAAAGSATLSIQIPAGQPSLTVPYTASGAIGTGQLDTTLTSASVSSSLSGFTAPTVSGVPGSGFTTSGTSITFSAPGTYTLTAQDSNAAGTGDANGVKATTTITITVTASGCTPPTQTESSSFTKSTIPSGDTLWLASVVNVSGLGAQGGTVQFASGTVSFKANGSTVTLPVPAATLIFSPGATSANTSYDAGTNTWQTIVPAGYTGNVFVAGVSYQAASSLSVSSGSIAWSGGYDSSTQNVSVQWSTTATLYSSFSASLNALGIKPVDSPTLSVYSNSDAAGTAEAYSSSSLGAAATVGGGAGATAISGLYPTGVSNSGSLLSSSNSYWSYSPVSDSHYTVTASSVSGRYTGAAVVAPTPLASGWVSNTSSAQWIYAPGGSNGGNGAGSNYLPASGSTALTDTYDYTLTFTLPAGTTSSGVTIGGTISADDSVQILVNGNVVTTNVPTASDYLYNTTASFTLNGSNASFQPGTNTITFRVANENTPTPSNASGLFVQTISGTVSTNPALAAAYCSTLSTQAGSPPTVTATNPAASSSYTITGSGGTVSVPVAFSATSPSGSGNITAVSATLNGQAVSLSGTTGVGTSATATGTATLSISAPGSYTLNYSGTNAYGSAATSVAFTVAQISPPSITITAPADGATITMSAGATTANVPYAITGNGNGAAITAATATVAGSTLSGSFSGLNTTSVSKSGTLSLPAGTYTLTASDTNSAGTTSAHITFSVVNSSGCGQGTNSGSEVLVWLQATSCGSSYSCNQNNSCSQTVTGGSIVPVTFGLYGSSHGWSDSWSGCWDNQCNTGDFVVDTSVVISVTEINSSGTSSPVLYTYGASGPNPPYFSISTGQYLLNLPTDSGTNHYEIEVYHPLNSGGTQLALLGSEDLYTRGSCLPNTSSISANFNGTAIASGNGIWFNSVVHVSGDSSSEEATLWFDSATVSFTIPGSGRNSSGTSVTLNLPSAAIKFDPNATAASTVYNAAAGCWVTIVPAGYNGNVFLTGMYYQVPGGFPSGLQGVTFSGNFRSDDSTIGVQWQWAAAVYKSYPANPASIGVKPVDSNSLSSYSNSDHAGTPEAYKGYVTGGAMGGGGSNYTGSYSGTATASVGSNSCWESSSLCNNSYNWNSGWSNNWSGGWCYNW